MTVFLIYQCSSEPRSKNLSAVCATREVANHAIEIGAPQRGIHLEVEEVEVWEN